MTPTCPGCGRRLDQDTVAALDVRDPECAVYRCRCGERSEWEYPSGPMPRFIRDS